MPIETKVKASTAAAAVSGIVLWILGKYVFNGNVPDVIASWVYALVPAVVAGAAGYLAPHTNRPVPGTVANPIVQVTPNPTGGTIGKQE